MSDTSGDFAGVTPDKTSTSANDPNNIRVWLGTDGRTDANHLFGTSSKVGVRDGENVFHANESGIRSKASAMVQWYHWTKQMQLDLAKKLYAWGYIDNPADIYGARDVYFGALDESAAALAAGRQQSPLEILDRKQIQNMGKLKDRMAAGPGSVTTPNPVMLYNKANVAAMVTTALQARLGRDPTEAEINTFYNAIHQHQLGNPGSETVVRGAGGKVVSDITTPGFNDASAGQLIDSRIKDNPEYAQYQAATTYFNAAMQANQAIGGA